MGIGWMAYFGTEGRIRKLYKDGCNRWKPHMPCTKNYFLGIQWASTFKAEHVYKYDHLWLLDSFSSRGGVGRYSTLPLWGASPLSLVSHMYLVVPSGTH